MNCRDFKSLTNAKKATEIQTKKYSFYVEDTIFNHSRRYSNIPDNKAHLKVNKYKSNQKHDLDFLDILKQEYNLNNKYFNKINKSTSNDKNKYNHSSIEMKASNNYSLDKIEIKKFEEQSQKVKIISPKLLILD